jgi:transcriptional regulator with XRE-family HTH domain
MKFSEAFRQTMFHFDLSGVEIAERSGISTAQISNFRHGKNLRIDTLERILNALPQEARVYMLNLVAQSESDPSPVVRDYEADPEDGADG